MPAERRKIMFFEKNGIYFTIRMVILAISTIGMMCSTTDFQYFKKKVIRTLSLYILYVLASTGIFVYFFGTLLFQQAALLIISLPGILLIYRLSKDQPAKAVFHYTTQILFSFYCNLTILLINTFFWNSALIDIILLITAYTLVILLEFRFLRRRFLRLSAIVKHGWGILSLIPCSLLILTAAIAFYPVHLAHNPSNILLLYLLAAVIVIIYFTIFQYLSMQYRFQFASHNMELLELQVNSMKERLSENETAAEITRIERHDARHRFQTIASLLEREDSCAALEYIHTCLTQLQKPDQIHYCSNPILNAILSSYLGQAKKEHIRLETCLSIPDRLPVDAMELSIVFANALENAIHACRLLPKEDRMIIIKCIQKPSLMFEISNPYTGTVLFSEEQLPVSAKNGHGIGSRSIAAFCKKHDAFYSFHAENGWFTVKVVM